MYKGIVIGGPINGQRITSQFKTVEAVEKGTLVEAYKEEILIKDTKRLVRYKYVDVTNGPSVFILERDFKELEKALTKPDFLYRLIMKYYK